MSSLITCPNCLYVYGDVQERCPVCESNLDGEGGRIQLDGTARAQVQRCGGLSGGVLELDEGATLLWCMRGLVLVDEVVGLRWGRTIGPHVDEVHIEGRFVRVICGRAESVLELADGELLE